MSSAESEPETPEPALPMGIDPVASRRIFLGMLGLIAGAAIAYSLVKKPLGPPPAAIAGDPLLVEGRTIYEARCVGCHGPAGRGDGAIAKSLPGPRVGDLAAPAWKHGDRPEEVRAVIAQGVKDTAMPAWGSVLEDRGLRAVAAYVYYLGGRKVPEALRAPAR